MKRLQKCCCCATTRTGTLILAWLGVVFGVLGVIGAWTVPMKTPEAERDSTLSRSLSTLNAIVVVILSVLLILGVKQRRSMLMLPWLIAGVIQAVVNVIVSLVNSVGFANNGDGGSAGANIIGSLIGLCIFFYLWGVVLSHYLDTRDEEKRGRYNDSSAGGTLRNVA